MNEKLFQEECMDALSEEGLKIMDQGAMVASQPKGRSKKSSLADSVYETLLRMLINKELPPGTLLNRRDVAKQLGVSVAPVLEAILQLELEGYLVTYPRKGTFVAPFGLREIYEHLILREALECQAARLYCGAPVRAHYEQLLVKAALLDSTFVDGQDNWKLENDFHQSLVELSESSMLINEFKRIVRLGTFYGMYHVYSSPGKELNLYSHHELLSILAKDNPDLAEHAIRDHLNTTKILVIDEMVTHGMRVLEMDKLQMQDRRR